jgi:hypothetical protein
MSHSARVFLLISGNANIAFTAMLPDNGGGNGGSKARFPIRIDENEFIGVVKKGMTCRVQLSNRSDMTARIMGVEKAGNGLILDCALLG